MVSMAPYLKSNHHFMFRLSELEIENEKLRKDCQLLRNSINRGVEDRELQGMYHSKHSIGLLFKQVKYYIFAVRIRI